MIKESMETSPLTDLFMSSLCFKDGVLTINDEDLSTSFSPKPIPSSSNSFPEYSRMKTNFQYFPNTNLSPINDSQLKESRQLNKRKYFTKQEDELLTQAAIYYEQKSWNLIAYCVPGRTPKQCRDRWVNYLQPSLQFAPWSEQEDQLLVTLVNTHGTHWTQMKSHFPNRSTNCIKNRWYWLIKNKVRTIPLNNTKNCSRISVHHENEFLKCGKNNNNNDHKLNNVKHGAKNGCNYSQNQNDYYFLLKTRAIEKRCTKKKHKESNNEQKQNKESENCNNKKINIETHGVHFDEDELMGLFSDEFFF